MKFGDKAHCQWLRKHQLVSSRWIGYENWLGILHLIQGQSPQIKLRKL
jgi:hypothetical protein